MLKRIKRIIGYSAHARFLAECGMVRAGVIPRQADIPSPYCYSPEWNVLRRRVAKGVQLVVIRETKHMQYDVFEVPADMVQNVGCTL